MGRNAQNPRRRKTAVHVGFALGWGLLIVALSLTSVTWASAPEQEPGKERKPVSGVASNALECLSLNGGGLRGAAGKVHLNWQGTAKQARLILTVSGADAAHHVQVNGRSVAQVPGYPGGQRCGEGEIYYLDIPIDAVVQGENLIELTDDGLPGDAWTAGWVRLEVRGDLYVDVPSGIGVDSIGAGDSANVERFNFTFINPYDGTPQDARAQIPDSYDGSVPTPLIIYVHGRSSDIYEWETLPISVAINVKGWLLAAPQMHGSWEGPVPPPPDPPGKFVYASLESQYDIIGTVKYMVQNYNVKLDRIYLVGSSMGGQIATVVAAKYPHVFAAVFDTKGPTNMAQWYGETTDGYHKAWMERECHINGTPRDPSQNPFCYQRRSSVSFAGNYLHIPISITHSLSDTLVPIAHSFNLRDAINAHSPDRLASVAVDTVVGAACPEGSPYHCYEADSDAVFSFLEAFTLNNNPTHINITTDESKSYYWLNVSQTGGDHWSQVGAVYYPISRTVTAVISDTQPLTLGFNLGSLPVIGEAGVSQPGMGLPATTYWVKGGGNNYQQDYVSGYLTVTLGTTGQFSLTISVVTYSVYLPTVARNP